MRCGVFFFFFFFKKIPFPPFSFSFFVIFKVLILSSIHFFFFLKVNFHYSVLIYNKLLLVFLVWALGLDNFV